jgi:hypothetical protein
MGMLTLFPRFTRTVRPSHALQDHPAVVAATKDHLLAVAVAAAAALAAVGTAVVHLLPVEEDVKYSSTTFVTQCPNVRKSGFRRSLLILLSIASLYCWLARSKGSVPPSWYVPPFPFASFSSLYRASPNSLNSSPTRRCHSCGCSHWSRWSSEGIWCCCVRESRRCA